MQIQINKKIKCVSVWLTNEESQNAEIQKRLNNIYAEYKNTKYKVAVFYSGSENLYDLTEGLIKHNKHLSEKSEDEAAGFWWIVNVICTGYFLNMAASYCSILDFHNITADIFHFPLKILSQYVTMLSVRGCLIWHWTLPDIVEYLLTMI